MIMSNDKKIRVMSAKGFLHKSTTKAALSAAAFLQTHREWLTTGDLAIMTSPILAKVDSKELMPTPALEEIKVVVLNHMIASEIRKGEEQMEAREAGPTSNPKNWIATIFDSQGKIQTRINAKGEKEELKTSYEMMQEADRWCDRRLVEGASDWFGTVVHATMVSPKTGDPISFTITRGDAMARQFAATKGPVMKAQSRSTGKLSFGVKVKEDRSRFSGC